MLLQPPHSLSLSKTPLLAFFLQGLFSAHTAISRLSIGSRWTPLLLPTPSTLTTGFSSHLLSQLPKLPAAHRLLKFRMSSIILWQGHPGKGHQSTPILHSLGCLAKACHLPHLPTSTGSFWRTFIPASPKLVFTVATVILNCRHGHRYSPRSAHESQILIVQMPMYKATQLLHLQLPHSAFCSFHPCVLVFEARTTCMLGKGFIVLRDAFSPFYFLNSPGCP